VSPAHRHRVVIVGAQFGGLAALAWVRRLAGKHRVDVTVIAPRETAVYRPDLVHATRGRPDFVRAARFEVAGYLRALGAAWVQDRVVGIDAKAATIHFMTEPPRRYDTLFWATGMDWAWELVPGLRPSARYICDDYAARATADAFSRAVPKQLVLAAGPMVANPRSLPSLPSSCECPLYETALLYRAHAARNPGGAPHIVLATPAPEVGYDLGPRGRAVLAHVLAEADIEVVPNVAYEGVDAGGLWLRGHQRLEADLAVWMPPTAGSRLARDSGLDDGYGWVPGNEYLQHPLWPNIYAIGDLSARTLPKMGHIAMVQARVAVNHWWSVLEKRSPPAPYTPLMAEVLETGHGRGLLTIQDVLYGGKREWVWHSGPSLAAKQLFGWAYRRGHGALPIMP